ncbi:hypothetical protein [Neodiprion sertifer nucleopolyhedrovirus]|uniref:Ac81 n=1 Tax=Neodiprion sertifer nucleopolyhedrovirus TaxID=111874 RepID=Q6JKB2_9CBAC|nr:hypothetical protein NeseNPV_gp48 [Neodiprion sertifer nucleopolyhedrovirus]AAQ96425.1 hypothetical protein [Neodiprion sertifer nucleopolyhedrovirus]
MVVKVNYNANTLIQYLFPKNNVTRNINTISIYKHNVQKFNTSLLSHFFAKIDINGQKFEIHPGSQPNTFQSYKPLASVDELVSEFVECDECMKKRLIKFVEDENKFNILVNNCEKISCQQTSWQSLIFINCLCNVFLFIYSNNNIFLLLAILSIGVLIYFNTYYNFYDKTNLCVHI